MISETWIRFHFDSKKKAEKKKKDMAEKNGYTLVHETGNSLTYKKTIGYRGRVRNMEKQTTKNQKNQDDDLLWLCIATGITCFSALVYTIYLWIC